MSQDDTSEAFICLNKDGEVKDWSGSAAVLFGLPSEKVEGKHFSDLIFDQKSKSEFKHLLFKTLDEGAYKQEITCRHQNGSVLFIAIECFVENHQNLSSEKISVNLVDKTQARSMQDADLIARLYGELLETTPDGIVVVNAAGRIVFVNSQASAMFDYARDSLLTQPVEILMEESLRSRHISHRTDYVDQPRVRSMGAGMELNGLRKDQSTFPVEISLSPFNTDAGTMYMSAIRDISERKKSEIKFRGLLESAPDAMVISDSSGEIILVNSQTEKLFGYTREELLGEKIEVLIPQRYRKQHPEYREKYFREPKFRPMGVGLELFGLRKDKTEFPVELSLSPLDTEEGLLVSAAIRDITERKKFEQELLEKNIQLVNANRAKDNFLASMSHELRTPLNAIIGFTGTLLMELPGPVNEDQAKQLNTIQGSSKHLLSLINDLLDLAKIEAGKMEISVESFDCLEIVRDVCTMLRPKADEKKLALVTDLPEPPLLIDSDRRALMQILSNLVSNAIKFTEEGQVLVRVIEKRGTEYTAILFSVIDTGIGIAPELKENLFTPFTQVHDKNRFQMEGTGLGIYLSQKLANMLGGEIRCESEPNKGSEFTLQLKMMLV